MVSSPPPNAPNLGLCRNILPVLFLLMRLARKSSRLYHTSSCVPSVVNPCSSNMICLRLPVVLPRAEFLPALPWIGQWIVCHLSLFGIRNKRFETFTQWRSCAHEKPFSCTIILLNQPMVPLSCFFEPPGGFESPSPSSWDWAGGLVQLGQMRRHTVPFLCLSLFPPHQFVGLLHHMS